MENVGLIECFADKGFNRNGPQKLKELL